MSQSSCRLPCHTMLPLTNLEACGQLVSLEGRHKGQVGAVLCQRGCPLYTGQHKDVTLQQGQAEREQTHKCRRSAHAKVRRAASRVVEHTRTQTGTPYCLCPTHTWYMTWANRVGSTPLHTSRSASSTQARWLRLVGVGGRACCVLTGPP